MAMRTTSSMQPWLPTAIVSTKPDGCTCTDTERLLFAGKPPATGAVITSEQKPPQSLRLPQCVRRHLCARMHACLVGSACAFVRAHTDVHVMRDSAVCLCVRVLGMHERARVRTCVMWCHLRACVRAGAPS